MTPEKNEEQKLEQLIASNPSLIKKLASLLGKLKLGVIEKPSALKTASSRINAKKATEARKNAPKTESNE